MCYMFILMRPSWSWSYGSWIYNYLCNQCISPLKLWVRIQFRRGVIDTTLRNKACQWLATGWWSSPGTPISSANKTDRHNITELLLKVVLNTIILTLHYNQYSLCFLLFVILDDQNQTLLIYHYFKYIFII